MPNYEHATSIGSWFFKALVESSKLRQMTFSEEAAHLNKANSRVQNESRFTAGAPVNYATFDQSHVVIMQGVHTIIDEASGTPALIHAYVPYPQGTGLAPFLRRPVPVVHGLRSVHSIIPTFDNTNYRTMSFDNHTDFAFGESELSMPETAVGYQGIDAVTDYKTSLVISHRWSNNESGEGIGAVHQVGWLFWRVIGHVAVY